MTQKTIKIKKLIAADGMMLTNGEAYGKEVFLGNGDDATNWVEITNEDLEFVVDMIRGEEGTEAYIKVFRPSINDYLEFNITRRTVENVFQIN